MVSTMDGTQITNMEFCRYDCIQRLLATTERNRQSYGVAAVDPMVNQQVYELVQLGEDHDNQTTIRVWT